MSHSLERPIPFVFTSLYKTCSQKKIVFVSAMLKQNTGCEENYKNLVKFGAEWGIFENMFHSLGLFTQVSGLQEGEGMLCANGLSI